MEASFYYLVRVKLIRFIKDDEVDFITDEKVFKDKTPTKAREGALEYYNSYIDTLLEPNLSHPEINKRLGDRIEGADIPETKEIESYKDIYIPPSYLNGIGVYMKVLKPMEDDKVGYEYLVHGVGFMSHPLILMDALNIEIEYYNHYGYNKDDKEISVRFYNYEDDELYDEVILKTPYDWTGLDVRTIEEEEVSEESNQTPNDLELVEIVLGKGENQIIEYKSSLVAFKNYAGRVGYSRHIKFKIIRAIASFLNTKGGILLIGVGDEGEIMGLESDFSLAGHKIRNPKDYFNLEIDKIIKEYFKPVSSNINGRFIEIEGKSIYFLRISPSSHPVFVMNQTDKIIDNHKKEFYIRTTGASSIHCYDIEDIVGYCMNHWGEI